MEILPFSYNWNNKLDCNVFTTLRLAQDKYYVGNKFCVVLNSEPGKHVEIIAVKKILIGQITDYIAGIDTGYSVQECQKLIKTMYKNSNIEWDKQLLSFILLKTITNKNN